jgi:hypothetical protein
VGTNAVNNISAGVGGIGELSSITGSSIYYAGGGGAGVENTTRMGFGGPGGAGGGGTGGFGSGASGISGSSNTGGGGGGGGRNANGGAGGSGIVIIRYPIGQVDITSSGIFAIGGDIVEDIEV